MRLDVSCHSGLVMRSGGARASEPLSSSVELSAAVALGMLIHAAFVVLGHTYRIS